MNWSQGFHGLYFDDEAMLYEDVYAVARFHALAVVDDGQRQLGFDVKSALAQLVGEAGFIGAFEQAGAEGAMDSNGAVHGYFRKLIEFDLRQGRGQIRVLWLRWRRERVGASGGWVCGRRWFHRDARRGWSGAR